MVHRLSIFFLLISYLCCFQLFGQDQEHYPSDADSVAVNGMLSEFIDAFSNLKWQQFSSYFLDDATAFFPPSAEFPFRANNKIEIEKIFKNVFENARKRNSHTPYIDIQPKDLKFKCWAMLLLQVLF